MKNKMPPAWQVIDVAPSYEVSNEGHIRLLNRGDKLTNCSLGLDGRRRVRLRVNGETRVTCLVYALVAKAFVDNPEGHNRIQFIDGDRDNVRADNLVWAANGFELADPRTLKKEDSVKRQRSSPELLANPERPKELPAEAPFKVSTYLGVTWVPAVGKWQASVQCYFGDFDSEEEAAKAHDRGAQRLFGREATVNFDHELFQPVPARWD
jgi:hypothetical protein